MRASDAIDKKLLGKRIWIALNQEIWRRNDEGRLEQWPSPREMAAALFDEFDAETREAIYREGLIHFLRRGLRRVNRRFRREQQIAENAENAAKKPPPLAAFMAAAGFAKGAEAGMAAALGDAAGLPSAAFASPAVSQPPG